jgi:ribosomal protein S12 methylthiotransferase accessory factor
VPAKWLAVEIAETNGTATVSRKGQIVTVESPEKRAELDRLATLVSSLGVVADVREADKHRGLGRVARYVSYLGSGRPGRGEPSAIRAGGQAVDDRDRARLVAIAEAAERYAGRNLADGDCMLATPAELDGPRVSLERVPRCSARELAGNCPLSAPDSKSAIRWVRGLELISGQPTWMPAVMACYGLPALLPAERFWFQISTGHAVHFDPVEALARGICEVVERDLIAVTWLQQLPLPVIDYSQLTEAVFYLLDWSDRHFIDSYLFDGTSDIGLPTVYCLQVAPNDQQARSLVGCGTGRTIGSAAEKALLETIGLRRNCQRKGEVPQPCEFRQPNDPADYMAQPEMATAFDFLVDGALDRTAPCRERRPEDSAAFLRWLINSLASKGMQIFAVERTPPELATAGLSAFCVVIPDLQPMSMLPRAQYLGHPRLYSAPELMGYPTRAEEELNPWPQPFA